MPGERIGIVDCNDVSMEIVLMLSKERRESRCAATEIILLHTVAPGEISACLAPNHLQLSASPPPFLAGNSCSTSHHQGQSYLKLRRLEQARIGFSVPDSCHAACAWMIPESAHQQTKAASVRSEQQNGLGNHCFLVARASRLTR